MSAIYGASPIKPKRGPRATNAKMEERAEFLIDYAEEHGPGWRRVSRRTAKYGAPSGGMVVQRRKHVEGIIYSRCGPVLPDDDAGREYLDEILSLTQDDLLYRKAKKLAPWMQEDERVEIVSRIQAMPTASRLASTVELGRRLRFTNEEREQLERGRSGRSEQLGAWQVRPYNFTDEDMAALAKEKKRLREERRRRKAGAVPRDQVSR